MAKNIAIIYSGAKYWGGVETYLKNLFKYYDRSKATLTLISLGSWPVVREIEKEGGHVKVFSGIRFNLITIFKIAGYLRKEKFELIVSGGLVADSYSRAVSFFSGISHLSIVHSEFKNDYPNLLLRSIYSFLLFISRWKTNKYIAVSEYIKKKLIQSCVGEKKITVVYNGVEFKNMEGRKPLTDGRIVIGSIGRLHAVKGYENLIKAAPLIKSGNYVIKIYGEGQEKTRLESLINELDINDKIKLCGYANDVSEILSETNIYIQPSLSEGFGLTVVEAMGAGLPVIVTPVGSLPEIVKNNETGIISEDTTPESLAKSLDALLSNIKKAQELGIAASADVRKNFDVKKWADETVETFLEAAK